MLEGLMQHDHPLTLKHGLDRMRGRGRARGRGHSQARRALVRASPRVRGRLEEDELGERTTVGRESAAAAG